MRVPQIGERIKEAPVVVLRGMLAGIGQVLLITDKLRNKAPDEPTTAAEAPPASATAPAPAAPAPAPVKVAPVKAEPVKARDPGPTGNVRIIEDQVADSTPEPAPAAPAGPVSAALPLDNYDELTVPSLRARLRNLTAAEVAELAEYERSHAARAEVITMFERRIAKLEGGS